MSSALYASAAVAALVIFVLRVVREPRRLGNAVWLGITALCGILFVVSAADHVPWLAGVLRGALVVLLVALNLVLPVALIVNGVLMWQRERRRPANLLSLFAGLGLAGCVAVFAIAGRPAGSAPRRVRWRWWSATWRSTPCSTVGSSGRTGSRRSWCPARD
ncbi:hypothetical protein [Amycolatopsis sp. ATCC 39116]|uniref:hypothetical protein n=1 Tax=Amycolatopsis sp. (strain ATCC 39116 / 75iv2) TaxID=385957 RepID=UPI001F16A8A8|nr:hypothetical protein [Amycolatopsis sp. ATCC 39116]